jgi:hypothetical protein
LLGRRLLRAGRDDGLPEMATKLSPQKYQANFAPRSNLQIHTKAQTPDQAADQPAP